MHGNLPPEHRWKVRDGAYLWIRDELELVRDSEGNPKEMVGVCLDISRRRLDDEELKFETGRVLKEIGSECGTIMRGRSI